MKIFYNISSVNSELPCFFSVNSLFNCLNIIFQINIWVSVSNCKIIEGKLHDHYLASNIFGILEKYNKSESDSISLSLTTFQWSMPISQWSNIYWMSFHIIGSLKILIVLFGNVTWRIINWESEVKKLSNLENSITQNILNIQHKNKGRIWIAFRI